MTEADDELFAGMIKEALKMTTPIAREIPAEEVRVTKAPRCPCGCGQYPYNLFDHKGRLLLLCCHVCEKERRALLKKDGETLTKDG